MLSGVPGSHDEQGALTAAERAHYREHGWVAVGGLVDESWLERLRAVTDEFVEASRELTESNLIFDLDAGHSAKEPRLRLSYTDLVKRSPHGEELIRGEAPRWARHDPRPCLLPPNGPYRPIFAAQQREAERES